MSTIRIVREILTILFGIGAIVGAVVLEAEDPVLYLLGVALICWGAWDIHKELRDSSKTGHVSSMSDERDRISKRLSQK